MFYLNMDHMLQNHVGREEREYGKVKGGKDGLCQAAVQAFYLAFRCSQYITEDNQILFLGISYLKYVLHMLSTLRFIKHSVTHSRFLPCCQQQREKNMLETHLSGNKDLMIHDSEL